MDLRPEDILYRPATNIEFMPCAYVKSYTAGTPPSIEVSNVNWFEDGQALQFIKPTGAIVAGAAGATAAVDPLAKTIELDVAPATVPAAGDTVLGPVIQSMGGTTGGLQWRETPEIITPEYDQVEGHVRIIKPHWDIECAFTLMEFNLAQWAVAMQQEQTPRAAGTDIAGARIFEETGDFVKPMGVRFTVEHPDPDQDLFFYILLFQAASITGIDSAFDKRTPTQLPVTIKALADVDRPRKKRFRMIIQEITAPTA